MGERIFFEGVFEAMCVQLGKVYQTQMHFFNGKQCLPVKQRKKRSLRNEKLKANRAS